MARLILLLPLALAACGGAAQTGHYPALVPVETLLIEAPPPPSPAPALEARASALRARAEALRTATP